MEYIRGVDEVMNIDIGFLEWLVNKKGYGIRSTRDVVSRMKRVSTIISLPEDIDEHMILLLNRNPLFNELSVSVRSQLRRALRLMIEFRSEVCEKKTIM